MTWTTSIASPWTHARVERLRVLHNEGLSFSEIAADLGGGLSRNACIGKATRIGLVMRSKTISEATKRGIAIKKKGAAPKLEPVKVKRLQRWGKSGTARVVEAFEPAPIPQTLDPDDIPFEQRKQLAELNTDDCRWPYGDPGKPDFFFCGAAKDGRHPSYCTMHMRVASGGCPSSRPYWGRAA